MIDEADEMPCNVYFCQHPRYLHNEEGCTYGEDDEFDYWPCGCEAFEEQDPSDPPSLVKWLKI